MNNVADNAPGTSALHLAAQFKHPECAWLLLRAGAEIDLTDRSGRTALGAFAVFCRV